MTTGAYNQIAPHSFCTMVRSQIDTFPIKIKMVSLRCSLGSHVTRSMSQIDIAKATSLSNRVLVQLGCQSKKPA